MGVKGQRQNTVQIGRICLINHGDENGKLCCIVDVVDQNRALVDGPVDVTGVARQLINFRSLALTPFVAPIPRSAGSTTVAKIMKDNSIVEKFQNSNWGLKLVKFDAKRNMTDLDRFKRMVVHKKRQAVIGREMAKIKREGKAPKIKARKPLKIAEYKKKKNPRAKKVYATTIVEDKKKGEKDDKPAAAEEKKKKK